MEGVEISTKQARARSDGSVLTLLSDPLNVSIIAGLASGPLSVSELSSRLGPVSRTTRFSRLRDLEGFGAILRRRLPGTPPLSVCALTARGRDLLAVLDRFSAWLGSSPFGPFRLDEISGALAVKALAAAWDQGVLRQLAERPRSVTELGSLCPSKISYHDARKTREALSMAGLALPVASGERGQPYALGPWASESVPALSAALRWERAHRAEEIEALTPEDGETLLMLGTQLLNPLSPRASGACELEIDRVACVALEIEAGLIVSAGPPGPIAGASRIVGSANAWLDTLAGGRVGAMRMHGQIGLTRTLAKAIEGRFGRIAARAQMDEFSKVSYGF